MTQYYLDEYDIESGFNLKALEMFYTGAMLYVLPVLGAGILLSILALLIVDNEEFEEVLIPTDDSLSVFLCHHDS